MLYRLLTDMTVLVHFGFVLFVVGGGAAVRHFRRVAPVHVLAVAWAVYVEAMPGVICPLTPLENAFAARAGLAGYQGGFIEHWLVPIIYPDGLTPSLQLLLAAGVFVVNAIVYTWAWRGRKVGPAGASSSAPVTCAVENLPHDGPRIQL
jgi:uncharacterized protein DUF2784